MPSDPMDELKAARQIHARWTEHKRPRIAAMRANALAEIRGGVPGARHGRLSGRDNLAGSAGGAETT